MIEIGDKIRVSAIFKNGTNRLNPTVVTLKIKHPDGTVTTYTTAQLTNPQTGVWYKDITIDQSGNWYVRFEGTGALVAAVEEKIVVKASEFYES